MSGYGVLTVIGMPSHKAGWSRICDRQGRVHVASCEDPPLRRGRASTVGRESDVGWDEALFSSANGRSGEAALRREAPRRTAGEGRKRSNIANIYRTSATPCSGCVS